MSAWWVNRATDAPHVARRNARLCRVCRDPILIAPLDADAHYVCDLTRVEGKVCVCVPGCSDKRVGDALGCKPECVPCRITAGQPVRQRRDKT